MVTNIGKADWESLGLSNDFLFGKVMSNPKICKQLLERILPDLEIERIEYPELQLGVVPGTKLPAVINIQDMISHHIAVLGVTGSGKTFISRKLIKEALKHHKVICIDFTGEYVQKLKKFAPRPACPAFWAIKPPPAP